jgi:hypothetical protein
MLASVSRIGDVGLGSGCGSGCVAAAAAAAAAAGAGAVLNDRTGTPATTSLYVR